MALEDLLKAIYEREFAKVPKQHSQRTTNCPPISTYIKMGTGDWPEEIKEHACSCIYCQKCLEAVWNALGHHPSEFEINDSNYINRIAVGHHINWAGCESCAAKVRKTYQ